ncbi:hypothetical protein T484DRAFT_1891468 [Baffinella frigidus]|nr:hypothetical protein T484DRAFT_1891468 [Cryptophyta sp. CCMP2293]
MTTTEPATPPVYRKTPMRPRAPPEHVTNVLDIHKKLSDSSKSVPVHIDEDVHRSRRLSEDSLQSRRVSDFLASLRASPPSPTRQPTLEFKVHTVGSPDFDWLNSTEEEDVEEPAAPRVYRKTPICPRAPPREPETIQGPSCEFLPKVAPPRPFEQKAEQHGGRMWEEYTAAIARLLQSAPRADTCVWRRGDCPSRALRLLNHCLEDSVHTSSR